MALDSNKLRNWAECDEAKARLLTQKDRYENKDQNQAYNDRVADRTAAAVAERLADAEAEIVAANQVLALPNLSDKRRKEAQADLLRATYQRDSLRVRDLTTAGPDAFLADVADEQNDVLLQVINNAIAIVDARRAVLTA